MPAIIHIALGSNRRHGRHGLPQGVVAAAIVALADAGLTVVARSAIRTTKPLGPSKRAFANAAIAVETNVAVDDLLTLLKQIERDFGRRRGRRWAERVLDLDIVTAGGAVTHDWRRARQGLIVPHRSLAARAFVLDPLVDIAPLWRHPVLHLTARQLRARQRRPKPQPAGSP
ncbi:2-amino-4-hydroxy-6-hydroxymethyldihydropteridine diphosphokinase [Polymorphobacter sp. PAMC 29334]|uniref:2-amino-4-hydroxy-6- hydroxymethyldihydropteridine diphosphokinase n=1 Tax=Polymorphobacter sp. PAMC 29334 TaxID=2862331 RepID=UPI001C78A77F|nr:2-amino-4-hydroxy-6-hydroxymethyldihydropteridine diphosphokinase [Polymorphobacter sp. PAMC 29334]QYE34512.1 2-amino-4-hydroxy-6-hydroxymethyldihydropteridine diphosphokinase [Polymorphobacter sp. PAMC 29334]